MKFINYSASATIIDSFVIFSIFELSLVNPQPLTDLQEVHNNVNVIASMVKVIFFILLGVILRFIKGEIYKKL